MKTRHGGFVVRLIASTGPVARVKVVSFLVVSRLLIFLAAASATVRGAVEAHGQQPADPKWTLGA